MKDLIFIALVLACPLMMMWMMRGGHGSHSGGGQEHGVRSRSRQELTLDELKAERDALNEEIGQRAEERDRLVAGPG
jgi:hypothetical protein